MKFYKKTYRYIYKLFSETSNVLTSYDVTTFAIISTVIITVIYLV